MEVIKRAIEVAIKIRDNRVFRTIDFFLERAPSVYVFDLTAAGMTYRGGGIFGIVLDASDWPRTSLTSPGRFDPNASGKTALLSKYPTRHDRDALVVNLCENNQSWEKKDKRVGWTGITDRKMLFGEFIIEARWMVYAKLRTDCMIASSEMWTKGEQHRS